MTRKIYIHKYSEQVTIFILKDCGCYNKIGDCDSTCPHFHYDEKGHTLSITCSGIFVPIQLEHKEKT